MSHCWSEHTGKKTTKRLVARLHLSWKASGAAKHINGLHFEDESAERKHRRRLKQVDWGKAYMTCVFTYSSPDLVLFLPIPPKLSRLNPEQWVVDSSTAWWPKCLPFCLSICWSLTVVTRKDSDRMVVCLSCAAADKEMHFRCLQIPP